MRVVELIQYQQRALAVERRLTLTGHWTRRRRLWLIRKLRALARLESDR